MPVSKVAGLVVAGYFAIALLLWFMAAFISGEFNAMAWDGIGRFVVTVIWFLCSACITIAGIDYAVNNCD